MFGKWEIIGGVNNLNLAHRGCWNDVFLSVAARVFPFEFTRVHSAGVNQFINQTSRRSVGNRKGAAIYGPVRTEFNFCRVISRPLENILQMTIDFVHPAR